MKKLKFFTPFKLTRTLTLLIVTLCTVYFHKGIAQEKLDRIGTTAKNENAPVMALRTNGNIIIASETQVGTAGDVNILVIEYDMATSLPVRRAEFGETNVIERPVDIIEQPNGDILVLCSRRGAAIQTGASVQRQHGFIIRIQNSGATTFATITRREIIPPAPTNLGATIRDFQVFPAKMRIDNNGDIIVTGHTLQIDVTIATGAFSIVNSFRTWLMELVNATLAINIQDNNYAGVSPTQVGNLIILPNTDLLITGYTNNSALSPIVTITDNTMSTRVSTNIPINLTTGGVSQYSNLYQSAMWNNELVMVGDYIPLDNTSQPHDVIVAKASIQNDRSVVVNSITAYNNPASVGGTIADGNPFNDFHDFRVSNIVIKGNELMVLGLVRDKNETQIPLTFTEFCVMSINLQDMSVNYTYVFSNMASYGNNTSRKIIVDNNGKYVFSGAKDFPSADKDLVIGRFDKNTKLECITNIEMEPYNLTWAHLNLTFNVGPAYTDNTFSIDNPAVTVASSTICTKGADPCAAVKDYVFYANNSTIFTNTVWGTQSKGVKYYINGTLTVQNVTLDITNCDVVFGPCAKIVFTGANARLRANNSVFRPCDDAVKWKGLVFQGGSTHRIIDCEIKNAMTGIEITNSTTNIEQIVNNTFVNNYIGINLSGAILNGTISGNHFQVNTPTAASTYLNPTCTPIGGAPTVKFYGIRALNSVIWAPIANNTFVAEDPLNTQTSKAWEFYGIYYSASVGVIEKNYFTNNTCAVYQTGNSASQPNFLNRVDENEISLSRTAYNAVAQIAIIGNTSQSINSLVKNNKLVNAYRMTYTGVNYVAIYVESCNNAVVEQNEIRGFDIGVHVRLSQSPEITLNDIKSYVMGIYVSLSEGERINCNTINMHFFTAANNALGIALDRCDLVMPIKSTIHSNCIFNTVQAIQLLGLAPSLSKMPSIRNNFLYNYQTFGIFISDVTGTIGTPTVAGMNTFAKNMPGAIDISNFTPPLTTAYGNFFQTAPVLGFNAAIAGATMHSVSACGQQTSGPNSTISGSIDNKFKCNPNGLLYPNEDNNPSGPISFTIPSNKDGSEYMESDFFGFAGANGYGLNKNVTYLEVLKKHYNNKDINPNTYYTCMSQYAQAGGDYANAIKYLEMVTVPAEDEIMKERKQIDLLRLKFLGELIDPGSMQMAENQMIQVIGKSNENYNQAYYVLSLLNGQADFKLPAVNQQKVVPANVKLSMSENAQLSVSPNPVKSDLMIEIISSASDLKGSGVEVSVVDITGKIIRTSDYEVVAGVVTMNMSDIPSGMYFINVVFADNTSKTVKFIKE